MLYKAKLLFVLRPIRNMTAQCRHHVEFLGAFAKLHKANVSFVMSLCPSTWNNWAPTERIFIKLFIREFFENLSSKIFDERMTRTMGTLHTDLYTFMIISV